MHDAPAPTESANVASRDQAVEFEALQTVIGALQPLSIEARRRILASVATFLQAPAPEPIGSRADREPSTVRPTRTAPPAFSENAIMSPKEFLIEKQPRTDVERIACLAYYLTHYEDTPSFKTLDLSKLNTRAAQPKFTNAAQVAKNAVSSGYLVPSSKGHRQLGAAGEQFVRALPDRDAARTAMAAARPKRRIKRTKTQAKNSN